MPVRNANATWEGTLQDGTGTLATETGTFEGQYSFSSRFEEGTGTNPEELIGAAHAGCFSMALSGDLARDGYEPERIDTEAHVHLDKGEDGFSITRVVLETEASVPDIDEETFLEYANGAKETCPVSRALTGVNIELNATLVS